MSEVVSSQSELQPKPHWTDLVVRIGLIIKGVDACFEIVGGYLLFFPAKIVRFLSVLATHEAGRHHVVMAGRLDHLGELTIEKANAVYAGYLLIHGLAKLILIYFVFKDKKWAFLGLIIVLSLFSAIEITRAVMAKETVTGILALFDVALAAYMAKDYREKFLLLEKLEKSGSQEAASPPESPTSP